MSSSWNRYSGIGTATTQVGKFADSTPMQCNIRLLAAENSLREAHQARGIAAIVLDLYLRDSHGIETFIQVFRAAPRIPIFVLAAAYDEHVASAAVQPARRTAC